MMKTFLIVLSIIVCATPALAKQKKKAKAPALREIHTKVKWGHKITKMRLVLGKKSQITLENSTGKKRKEFLDTKDSAYIIKEFKRLPASMVSKNCDEPMTIEIQTVPSDGRKRSLCLNKQPKTAKSYKNFANLMEFASRKKTKSR